MQAVSMPSHEDTYADKREPKLYIISDVAVKPSRSYLFWKRFFDIVASVLIGSLLFLPMLVIGVVIWCSSKGPALYKQERLGQDGRKFTMLKFRSMTNDAEAEGPQWARENDQRCTKVGAFLRKTRLDELPQFWNILKGDMSFVGPRPEREYFYDQFETYIVGFRKRLQVKPGLTGLAQVNGGYNLLPEEKIVYDMEYIGKMSLSMDIKCILKTFRLILSHEGAR